MQKCRPSLTGKNFDKDDFMKNFVTGIGDLRARFVREEEGQDLIEYALVVALIALAATAGMQSLATSINNAFTKVGTKLTSYVS